MTRQEKINQLIGKEWVEGHTLNDKPLIDWLEANWVNDDQTVEKDFCRVQYNFGPGGYDITVGRDSQDIANNTVCCSEEWKDIEDSFLDHLLSL